MDINFRTATHHHHLKDSISLDDPAALGVRSPIAPNRLSSTAIHVRVIHAIVSATTTTAIRHLSTMENMGNEWKW